MYSLKGDEVLVIYFQHHAIQNVMKTAQAGRPIFDDIDVVVIRGPGSMNTSVHPATERSHWGVDPQTGGQVPVTYAERFAKQYRQFKEHQHQTMSGTPLSHAPFLSEARRAELRALAVYTVEQLALIDGQELKNLGQGGRDLKNRAQEYMEDAKNAKAPGAVMLAELEALRSKNQLLTEDLERARAKPAGDAEFEEMTDQQLADYVKAQTGHAPQGALSRKTLVRMAKDARPSKAA